MELDRRMTFDRFVVGPANQLAATAARRAAESPGTSYNPLVIVGPTGLGKTHLLAAIAHHAKAMEPELSVHYETVESFIDRLTAAIAGDAIAEFRSATGRMGIFLLDDLQDVAGKARTQEELLLTWGAMLGRGAQVVVASDRAPQEIPALDRAIAERLAGGLIVDVAAPEPETRRAIAAQIIADRGETLPGPVIDALSVLAVPNVRELDVAIDRVLRAAGSGDGELSPERVEEIVELGRRAAADVDNEFGDFLSDISTAVAAVVETAPWRRRIAQAILRWEGDGIRTRRLENALDADSAPDVDALLTGFSRDVARLREIAAELTIAPGDPLLLLDPDRLAEAEQLLARSQVEAPPAIPDDEPAAPVDAPAPRPTPIASADPWFLDREKLAWGWLALDERLVEEPA